MRGTDFSETMSTREPSDILPRIPRFFALYNANRVCVLGMHSTYAKLLMCVRLCPCVCVHQNVRIQFSLLFYRWVGALVVFASGRVVGTFLDRAKSTLVFCGLPGVSH